MVLKNKKILITGASSGIGLATAKLLIENGAQLYAIGRKQPEFEYLEDEQLKYFYCDLSDLASIENDLSQKIRHLDDISGAVFCHGYGDFGALEQFSANRIKKLVDTNFISTVLLSRLFLPRLKTQKDGNLIFIGSEAGLKGGKNGAVYSASKFALRGFVQALRQECSASNVKIGIVNPGMVDTAFFEKLDFQPGESHHNYLQACEIADAVYFMLSMPEGSVVDEINLSPQKSVIRNKQ